MSKVTELMRQKNWEIKDLSYHSRLSQGACYQAMRPGWPFRGTNWKTIQAIARALGVKPEFLISDNNTEAQ